MPHFTSSDGITLHYRDAGTGPAVLCLSGLTRNGEDFDYAAPHLAECRLIRLDYRGRGKSDWADPATYSIAREMQDALELMDHLGLARAAILGTSRGGIIALAMTAAARDRLTGVCFNDVGPEIDMSGIEAIMGFLGRNPTWKTWGEAATQRATVMAGFANVPASRWREEVTRHYHQTPEGLIINYDPRLREAVEATRDSAVPTDLWDLYTALKGLPVAVIRGANSDILSQDTFARMRARLPGVIAAEVPDRGHVPFLDEPASVAALREWVGRL